MSHLKKSLQNVCTINSGTWSSHAWIAESHWLQSPKEVGCNKLSPLHDDATPWYCMYGWTNLQDFVAQRIKKSWIESPVWKETNNQETQGRRKKWSPLWSIQSPIWQQHGLELACLDPCHPHHRGLGNSCMRSLFHKTKQKPGFFRK